MSSSSSASNSTDPQDLYHYDPSKAAAIIFAAAYGLSALMHEYQWRATKPQKFTIPLTLGATFSFIGFVNRALYTFDISRRTTHMLSAMFILGAAPTYAGADYFVCGRLFSYLPSAAPISPLRVVRTYIFFDLLAEVGVWSGAALSSSSGSSSKQNVGVNLLRAAMIIQGTLFITFAGVVGAFHVRVRRMQRSWNGQDVRKTRKAMTLVFTLYVSSLLIIARSIYHIAESFVSDDNVLKNNEYPFIILEALLMLLNTGMFNVLHPGFHLPKDSRMFVGADGSEKRSDSTEGALHDYRPFVLKIIDPLDVRGLFKKDYDASAPERKSLTSSDVEFGNRSRLGHH